MRTKIIRSEDTRRSLVPGSAHYPTERRRHGTERDYAIFPTSLTGDVTLDIAEDDWERGCTR